MTIIVAVSDNAEGRAALDSAIVEAQRLGTDLVAVNLALHALRLDDVDGAGSVTVVDRIGRADRDPVDAVLDEVAERDADRLVIGVRRRSAVSKAVLGSVTQRLLLNSPVPVLAVKAD